MSLIPVEAVRVVCDGCKTVFMDDSEFTCFERETLEEWIDDRDWMISDDTKIALCDDCVCALLLLCETLREGF